jgi:zinc transport system substrate-binding protein
MYGWVTEARTYREAIISEGNMRRKSAVTARLGLILVCVLVMGCGKPSGEPGESTRETGKPKVYTTNYPLKYFAERIAGEHAEVILPVPADGDPAFWEPEAEDIAALQEADLIMLNGATYEKWLNKVTLPPSKLVDTSAGFKDRYIVTKGETTHSHGPGGEHSHTGTAFTTWIDFMQAVEQAKAVRDALVRRIPEKKVDFEHDCATLEGELLALDKEIEAVLGQPGDRPLVASHPVYQYFARRYGLNLKSVLWEPEEVPEEAEWQALAALLKEHPAKWMVWEGEPAEESVARLKTMGVESLVFDPCGNVPDEGDFMAVMRGNVANLRGAFEALPGD